MAFLKGVNIPGFFWVLFIALLGASTYRVQYGEIAFFIVLALFAALKLWQMYMETKRAEAQKHVRILSASAGTVAGPIEIEGVSPPAGYGYVEMEDSGDDPFGNGGDGDSQPEPEEEPEPFMVVDGSSTVKGKVNPGKVQKFFLS